MRFGGGIGGEVSSLLYSLRCSRSATLGFQPQLSALLSAPADVRRVQQPRRGLYVSFLSVELRIVAVASPDPITFKPHLLR